MGEVSETGEEMVGGRLGPIGSLLFESCASSHFLTTMGTARERCGEESARRRRQKAESSYGMSWSAHVVACSFTESARDGQND